MCVYSAWALSPERGDLDQTSLRGASVRGETARSSHLAQLASECVCVCDVRWCLCSIGGRRPQAARKRVPGSNISPPLQPNILWWRLVCVCL